MKNILFFGDSLTAGYGLVHPATQSFPALIKSEAIREGLDCSIINAGLSGDTTAGALLRLDTFLRKPVDIFVLGLGANDMIRGYDPSKTRQNLVELITRAEGANKALKTLLLGMELPPWVPESLAGGFREVYREVAAIKQAELVPFLLQDVVGHRELNLPDGLHPNAAGYRVIAATVWKKLKPMLK
ncbi:arylesterase [Pedobacter yulinensis]|uniref:Arylesterase n=1 Tax=Pedobacter yulinensis TaxID=2126353 RepID=A0A2T3HN10_9SPHI|nr:arylesterase [Pedobacter yulinensis]